MKKYIIIAIVFLLGLSLGFFGIQFINSENVKADLTNEECKLNFINPLRCLEEEIEKKSEYTAFRKEIEEKIDNLKQQKLISHVSVYFRDLESGPTMSIDEQQEFAPASLLKVPLLLAVLKKAESESNFLNKKVTITVNIEDPSQQISPEKSVEKGKTYTIDELLYKSIVYSDNKSTVLLRQQLTPNKTEEEWYMTTLSNLGIKDYTLNETAGEDIITVKNYASIFRILYNASYLNRNNSEKALSLLSQSDFNSGIVAGVPKDVNVAHKFGVRDFPNEAIKQLHDCGVVYYPDNHYLICIMTRGTSMPALVKTIQDISRLVFEEVKIRS